jgi:hypothetical protein
MKTRQQQGGVQSIVAGFTLPSPCRVDTVSELGQDLIGQRAPARSLAAAIATGRPVSGGGDATQSGHAGPGTPRSPSAMKAYSRSTRGCGAKAMSGTSRGRLFRPTAWLASRHLLG